MLSMVGEWVAYLVLDVESAALHGREPTSRPFGDTGFVNRLGKYLGRVLGERKSGPKVPRKANYLL